MSVSSSRGVVMKTHGAIHGAPTCSFCIYLKKKKKKKKKKKVFRRRKKKKKKKKKKVFGYMPNVVAAAGAAR